MGPWVTQYRQSQRRPLTFLHNVDKPFSPPYSFSTTFHPFQANHLLWWSFTKLVVVFYTSDWPVQSSQSTSLVHILRQLLDGRREVPRSLRSRNSRLSIGTIETDILKTVTPEDVLTKTSSITHFLRISRSTWEGRI